MSTDYLRISEEFFELPRDSLGYMIGLTPDIPIRSAEVAKKKAEAASTPKPKGRPKLANQKPPTPIVMTIRGRPEWEEWLDRLCEAVKQEKELNRIDRTEVVDAGLRLLAERHGMPSPPDRY